MRIIAPGLAGLALLGFSAPVMADEKPSPPTVSVIGEATAEVRPDIAIIGLEISDDRPTPLDASNENARLATAVVDGLKGSGVEAKDISTVGASLSPIFSEQHDPTRDPRALTTKTIVTGYRARNVIRVKVRDIGRAGAIIGTSVQNGALYDDIAYQVSDREARLDVLRGQAAANAVHRAGLYAEGAGVKLGPIRSLSAEGASPPMEFASKAPRPMARQAPAAEAVEIEPGVVTLSDTVSATFELVGP